MSASFQRVGALVLLIGVLLGVSRPPAYSQVSPASPPELHEALIGQIGKLNPLFADSNPVDRDITALIFEGLTTLNEYGEPVPDLAERWTVSRDGLEYVFALRRDVLWQDGLPFTAADVAYTIRTVRAPDFPGDPSLAAFWRTVEMNVLDEYTIRFRLVQPMASFPEHLRLGILPVHALEGAPVATLDQHPFNLDPIGTGPYQLENLLALDGQLRGVSLRVAPNYRLRPEGASGYALDRLVFTTYPTAQEAIDAYLRGEVNSLGHMDVASLPTLNNIETLETYATLAPAVGVLIYNWQRDDLAYFRNPRMQRAFALATDREQAIRPLTGRAVLADSPILSNSWAFTPQAQYPTFNLEAARALLGQVSFEPYTPPAPPPQDGGEGAAEEATPEPQPVEQRREFRIMVVDDPGIAGVAFEIVNQWIVLGFGVELDMVDAATFQSRLQAGDFDVALVEYSLAPLADPDQFALWHQGQADSGQNFGGMSDRRISVLLAQARTATDGNIRKALYDDFQISFASRAPAIVLYNPLFIYALDSRFEGVQLDFISTPSDRFRTIQDWTFNPGS